MTIVIVDTSILLDILDVPGRNQHRDEIRQELKRLVAEPGTELFLPLVTVVETGNHIAQLQDGRLRRARGAKLVELVRQALRGEAPWVLVPFPEPADLEKLLDGLAKHLVCKKGFADADHRDLRAGEASLAEAPGSDLVAGWSSARVRIGAWAAQGRRRSREQVYGLI